MGHRPKIAGAASESFWISVLFQQLRTTPILVNYGTGGIGNMISLSFYAYVDHPNQRLGTSGKSISRKGGPGLRVGLEVRLLDFELA
jgi:hypothetical protein